MGRNGAVGRNAAALVGSRRKTTTREGFSTCSTLKREAVEACAESCRSSAPSSREEDLGQQMSP